MNCADCAHKNTCPERSRNYCCTDFKPKDNEGKESRAEQHRASDAVRGKTEKEVADRMLETLG